MTFPPEYPLGANPSFADLLRRTGGGVELPTAPESPVPLATHATTVLGLRFADGVVMAGDRRATEGFSIADERIEKVFAADDHSAIAIAGAAGQATEIVRLFQTELEHYEKVEGDRLSLEGKANRLAMMIRQNFGYALQGLVVVPLFGGYDAHRDDGRLFRYDVTGGRWEEFDFHARAAVEALYDASQEDVATGGPDPIRGIYPTVKAVTAEGVVDVAEEDIKAAFEAIIAERTGREPTGFVARGREEDRG